MKLACTISGVSRFGMTWRSRTSGRRVPMAWAAWMYGCSRMVSTSERTRRTTRGISGSAMAITTVAMLAWISVIRATASRMPGIAIMPSMKRMMILSARRLKPAIVPMRMPVNAENSATETPTSSETRAPYSVRERISRPSASVPSGNSADGGFRRWITFISVGSCGTIHGANSASAIISASRKDPATNTGWRRAKVSARGRCRWRSRQLSSEAIIGLSMTCFLVSIIQ